MRRQNITGRDIRDLKVTMIAVTVAKAMTVMVMPGAVIMVTAVTATVGMATRDVDSE